MSARLEAQHAGRVYVDNNGTEANSIAPHTVWNAAVSVAREALGTRATATVRALNLTDLRYETNGYMDFDRLGALVPHRTPAATRAWLAEVRFDW